MQRDFDSLLSRFFGAREAGDGGYLAPYPVDVREDADHIYVECKLPGYRKEEIDITLENQTLVVTAQRNEQQERGKKGDMLLHERPYSCYQRSFTLPATVDKQIVNAKLQDGLLTITLNKREETKPRKIQVS